MSSATTFDTDLFGAPIPAPVSRRMADWRREMAKIAVGFMARARTPEEAEAQWEKYEQLEAEGPDFAHYRGKSEFKDAPQINLDGNALARLRVLFTCLSRRSYDAKRKGRHCGIITRAAADVFGALMYLAAKYGRVFPSYVGLAHLAGCCPSAVAYALTDLVDLGFVTRHRRLKRITTPLGFKVVQNTNAYEVHEPRTALGRLAVQIFGKRSDSNKSRASEAPFIHKRNLCRTDATGPLQAALDRLASVVKPPKVAPGGVP